MPVGAVEGEPLIEVHDPRDRLDQIHLGFSRVVVHSIDANLDPDPKEAFWGLVLMAARGDEGGEDGLRPFVGHQGLPPSGQDLDPLAIRAGEAARRCREDETSHQSGIEPLVFTDSYEAAFADPFAFVDGHPVVSSLAAHAFLPSTGAVPDPCELACRHAARRVLGLSVHVDTLKLGGLSFPNFTLGNVFVSGGDQVPLFADLD